MTAGMRGLHRTQWALALGLLMLGARAYGADRDAKDEAPPADAPSKDDAQERVVDLLCFRDNSALALSGLDRGRNHLLAHVGQQYDLFATWPADDPPVQPAVQHLCGQVCLANQRH